MTEKFPFISVVIPVKDEGAVLARCLDSLTALNYPKEHFEVIIADGMSKDNTREIALSYGADVVPNVKALVSSGRNRGFEKSRGDLIAFTDADCVLDTDWLINSVKYFAEDNIGGVGGVTLLPEDASDFEKAVDFIFNLAEFFGATSHKKRPALVRKTDDIPGCNAVYRREALEKVMPVDENLLTAEDVWMNFLIRKSGYRLIAVPDVILRHYRRSSPRSFLRQVYRFAVGRAQAGKRNMSLLKPLHILAGLGIPLAIFAPGWTAAVILFLSILNLIRARSMKIALNTFLALIIFLLSWSFGFLKEFLFPLKDAAGK